MSEYIKTMREKIGHSPILQCGASVIVYKDGKILLQRRKDNDCFGYAGGSVELYEEVEETAKRELFEETGLTALNLELFGVFSGADMAYVYPNKDEVSNIDIVFVCTEFAGEVITSTAETVECRWFDIENLPANISPPNKRPLQKFIEDVVWKKSAYETLLHLETVISRREVSNISDLVADDFIEFCSSGETADKAALILEYSDSGTVDYTISEFQIKFLSGELVQATYISELDGKKARRQSLWKYQNLGWRMVFHQGTPMY